MNTTKGFYFVLCCVLLLIVFLFSTIVFHQAKDFNTQVLGKFLVPGDVSASK